MNEQHTEKEVVQRTRDDVGNVLRTGKSTTLYLKYETKDDLKYIKDVTGESYSKIVDRLVEAEADKLDK